MRHEGAARPLLFYSDFGDKMQDRIDDAVEIILNYGDMTDYKHQRWVLDQVLRVLTKESYRGLIEGQELINKRRWDIGEAP